MKRYAWVVCLLLSGLLLTFSDAAALAAASAVSLWLTRVLPALFPFYVATALLMSGGLYETILRRLPGAALPACMLLGGIAGYPVGARLCALSGREQWSVCCNLCSPAFLLGVVAIGMLGDKTFAAPLMLAHYGAAVFTALLGGLRPSSRTPGKELAHTQIQPMTLPQVIFDGMLAMLKIGGCIIFFSVCAALASAVLRLNDPLFSAIFTALLEMTAGCQAISALPLPKRLICACLAAAVSFGGLSIWMQARSVADKLRAWPYLFGKLFQASVAFLLAYIATPWFYSETSAVVSVGMENMLSNTASMTLLLLAASTGMIFAYLFAVIMKRARGLKAESPYAGQ